MKCKHCGKENFDDAKFCEYCGAKLEEEVVHTTSNSSESSSKSKIIIGILVIVILVMGVFMMMNSSKEQPEESIAVKTDDTSKFIDQFNEAKNEKDYYRADTMYQSILDDEELDDEKLKDEVKRSQKLNEYEMLFENENWEELFYQLDSENLLYEGLIFNHDEPMSSNYSGHGYVVKSDRIYGGEIEDGQYHGKGILVVNGEKLYSHVDATFDHDVIDGKVIKTGYRKPNSDYPMDQRIEGYAINGYWDGTLQIDFLNSSQPGGYIEVDYGTIIPIDTFELNGETCHHHVHGNDNWYVTDLDDYRVLGGDVAVD